jgi:hypothetical protein
VPRSDDYYEAEALMIENRSAFDYAVAEARIARLEESLRVCMAEKELLEQERDAALYEIDRLTGR